MVDMIHKRACVCNVHVKIHAACTRKCTERKADVILLLSWFVDWSREHVSMGVAYRDVICGMNVVVG